MEHKTFCRESDCQNDTEASLYSVTSFKQHGGPNGPRWCIDKRITWSVDDAGRGSSPHALQTAQLQSCTGKTGSVPARHMLRGRVITKVLFTDGVQVRQGKHRRSCIGCGLDMGKYHS